MSIFAGDLRQQVEHQKMPDMTPFCGVREPEADRDSQQSSTYPGPWGTVPMAGCGGGFEEAIRQGPAQSTTVLDARL